MPLYEYECQQCQRHTEKRQKFSDPEITTCPHCGGHLQRVITAPAIAFKGGGWYADGYGNAKPKSSPDGGSSSDGKASGEGKAPSEAASSGDGKSQNTSTDSASKSGPAESSKSSAPTAPASPALASSPGASSTKS